MALRTRVWSAGKLLLLGSALAATYVLFAAAAMRVALRTREVQVPNLTDRTANEASAIAALGCRWMFMGLVDEGFFQRAVTPCASARM